MQGLWERENWGRGENINVGNVSDDAKCEDHNHRDTRYHVTKEGTL